MFWWKGGLYLITCLSQEVGLTREDSRRTGDAQRRHGEGKVARISDEGGKTWEGNVGKGERH